MTDRIVNWSTAEIDRALVTHRKRYLAALKANDLSTAATEEGWLDRLLDARPHHPAPSEAP